MDDLLSYENLILHIVVMNFNNKYFIVVHLLMD